MNLIQDHVILSDLHLKNISLCAFKAGVARKLKIGF